MAVWKPGGDACRRILRPTGRHSGASCQPQGEDARPASGEKQEASKSARTKAEPVPQYGSLKLPLSLTTYTTYRRVVILLLAAILTTGRRTVTSPLWTVGPLACGHASSYDRVFCRRRWSGWRPARALAGLLLRRWVPKGPVPLCGDDTVDEHRGTKVYGKACHRDAVRSTHSFTAYRWGHKWVVLAILVKSPFRRSESSRKLPVDQTRRSTVQNDQIPRLELGILDPASLSTKPTFCLSRQTDPNVSHGRRSLRRAHRKRCKRFRTLISFLLSVGRRFIQSRTIRPLPYGIPQTP